MTGKAKEHFDLWEADHDPTSAKKTCETRSKTMRGDVSWIQMPNERMQQEGGPTDVGAVTGWEYDYDCDQDGVYAIGFKGKGKDKGGNGGKVKIKCYNCGSAGHFWREPSVIQGQKQG